MPLDWTHQEKVLGLKNWCLESNISETKRSKTETLMSKRQDEIKDIVSQLQRLQTRESELLQRLEGLNEAENHTSASPTPTRDFRIGDLVRIKNPKPFQIRQGHIIKIGDTTNYITVQSRSGSKIVRASFNLTLIE
jgi:dsDNA-specific endonuclease/ATPase MutS2